MIRESQTAVVARNERWTGAAATEPYEAGWAKEAVIFVRALADATGSAVRPRRDLARRHALGARGHDVCAAAEADEVTFARVGHFGNWMRVAADLPDGAALTVLVTYHLKG